MINIVLVEPKMPANTGNIMRLCANSNTKLHLVGPMPFTLETKQLRRAGLDYRDWAEVKTYHCWSEFYRNQPVIGCSTHASTAYHQHCFKKDDWLVFGSETHGLSDKIRNNANFQAWLRIPMHPNSRSLNLANSVSIIVYEALRQLAFPGLA